MIADIPTDDPSKPRANAFLLCMLMILLAIAGCAESPQGTNIGASQQPAPELVENELDARECELVEPAVNHGWRGTLYRINNLDVLGAMTNVVVKDAGNVEWAKNYGAVQVTAQNFPELMGSATPIAPDAELIDEWQYGPNYWVKFECCNRSWKASLFLGGLGFLVDDKGQTGAFMCTSSKASPRSKLINH